MIDEGARLTEHQSLALATMTHSNPSNIDAVVRALLSIDPNEMDKAAISAKSPAVAARIFG